MTTKSTIGITGANGFIGSSLTNFLIGEGFSVVPFVRKPTSEKSKNARKYDLVEESIPDDLFKGIDILIHCAFITKEQNADAEQLNFTGTKRLIDVSRNQGVKKIIFFSSVTADENAKSAYSKSKFAIHQLLNKETDLIIRCSLVIGEGGLFRKMLNYAISRTFIPLIGSGRQIIQLIAIEDVQSFVSTSINNNLHGNRVLASTEQITYKQLFKTIAAVYGKRIHFVPVPLVMLKMTLNLCRILNIRTPVSQENLLGFQTVRTYDTAPFISFPMTLKNKLEAMRRNRQQVDSGVLKSILKPFFQILRRPPAAVSRWQLLKTLIQLAFLKRLRKNEKGVKVKLGRYTINGPDYQVISTLLKEKFAEDQYYFQSGTTQPIIFDCGANIGISMLYFKNLYPDCQIHCFEPFDGAYEYLEKNVRENRFKNVFLYRKAISGTEGEVALFTPADQNVINATLIKNKMMSSYKMVQSIKLSTFIRDFNEVDFIKLDVEGAEAGIISDLTCSGELAKKKIKNLTMEYHIQMNGDQLRSSMQELMTCGYKVESKILFPKNPQSDILLTATLD
jgi:FkbM family methyltransferase